MKNLNHHFYYNAFVKHGISAKGVHWHSKNNQYKRFEILTSFIKEPELSTIIDVGCGYAEYMRFLEKENLKVKEYIGIDCEEFMLNLSQKRFTSAKFIKCNILKNEIPKGDYLICSGTLNILKKDDFLKSIEKCYFSSNKGFAFNFLTKNHFHKLSKKEIFDFCKELTTKISIKNNYLPNDMSIYLEK